MPSLKILATARAETELRELVPSIGAIRHAKRHFVRWMRPERRHVAMTFYSAACLTTVGAVPATVARRISRGCDWS
ncbi:MAG: hypothetical protein NVSMB26_00910 [Beijerinckiaceae bacterium]